jgi:hypothetical protein
MTRATCSDLIFAAALASRAKRATTGGCSIAWGSKNLSATRCSSSVCIAETTTPMPPRPSTRSTRYLPAMSSPMATGMESSWDINPGA